MKKFKGSHNKLFNPRMKKKKRKREEEHPEEILLLKPLPLNFDNTTKVSMKYAKFYYQIDRMRRAFRKQDP